MLFLLLTYNYEKNIYISSIYPMFHARSKIEFVKPVNPSKLEIIPLKLNNFANYPEYTTNLFDKPTFYSCQLLVEQISWAIFQGGGLWSTTFVSIYQNVRIGL